MRRAHRLDLASNDEINEAGNIVLELGQFPLAIDQAGAYLEETQCSLQDYLQIYHQHQSRLLARPKRQEGGHPDSVATTSLRSVLLELGRTEEVAVLEKVVLQQKDDIEVF